MSENFEVEVRGLLSQDEYDRLTSYLEEKSSKKQMDDRKTVFFEIPDATLKVAQRLQVGDAKIALKLGDISKSIAQREVEVTIPEALAEPMVQMLSDLLRHLGHDRVQHTQQRRVNYWLGETEWAVKWSQDLGHHFEAEKVVRSEAEVPAARKELVGLTESLGLRILTTAEMNALGERASARHRKLSAGLSNGLS